MKIMLRYLLVKTINSLLFPIGTMGIFDINKKERARDQKEVQLHEQI